MPREVIDYKALADDADKSTHPADLADAIRALGRQHEH